MDKLAFSVAASKLWNELKSSETIATFRKKLILTIATYPKSPAVPGYGGDFCASLFTLSSFDILVCCVSWVNTAVLYPVQFWMMIFIDRDNNSNTTTPSVTTITNKTKVVTCVLIAAVSLSNVVLCTAVAELY